MKERPILFSGPMVRAILEGRKTVTRRVVKLPKTFATYGGWDEDGWPVVEDDGGDWSRVRCPYGESGDVLWVRETWGLGTRPDPGCGWVDGVEYRADCHYLEGSDILPLNVVDLPEDEGRWRGRWHPSIHMPKWACRLRLKVTDVRPERLKDITTADIHLEGFQPEPGSSYGQMRHDFAVGWAALNATRGYSWASNPWVWVVSFEALP